MSGDLRFWENTCRGIIPSGKEEAPGKYVDGNIGYWLVENDNDLVDEDFYGAMVVGDSKRI